MANFGKNLQNFAQNGQKFMNFYAFSLKFSRTQRQFALYLVLGSVLTLCSWAAFWLLAYVLQMHYLLASLVVFVVISALGLVVYKRAIFKHTHMSAKAEISTIYAINIVGAALNSGILWVLVEFAGLESLVGQVITSFLLAFYSFSARKILVYKG